MHDLSPSEVGALARSIGLPMSPEDLGEVTHRLNAFLEALAPLADLPLETAEPLPLWLDPEQP